MNNKLKITLRLVGLSLMLTTLLLTNACRSDVERSNYDINVIALTNDNNLLTVNSDMPSQTLKRVVISGLRTNEKMLGIDFRPATGQLYALGSTSRLYTINASSGAATAVGTIAFTPVLSGTQFGFDFNPTVDRIRIVSNTGQNLRAHPETGVIAAVDGNLNPGTPTVSAAAYTNNFAGATTTTLYVMDVLSKKLYTQNPPNNGTLVNVGDLQGANSDANGFDIGGTSGKAFAVFNEESAVKLYQVNLQNAQLTSGASMSIPAVRAFTLGLGF